MYLIKAFASVQHHLSGRKEYSFYCELLFKTWLDHAKRFQTVSVAGWIRGCTSAITITFHEANVKQIYNGRG